MGQIAIKPGAVAGALVFLFLTFNFANLTQYGQNYDEVRAHDRGRLSWKLAVSFLPGSEALSEKEMSYLRSLYHPPFFAMLNFGAANAGEALGLDCVAAKHYFPVIWSALGLIALYFLASRAFGGWPAVGAVFFLMLFPRFIAHSHYNPKDVPLLSAVVAGILYFHRFLKMKTVGSSALAGVALGLAFAIGLHAVFILPALVGGAMVMRKDLAGPKLFGIFFACALLALYAAWPLLWADPGYWWTSGRFFSGKFLDMRVPYLGDKDWARELPWHYTPVNLFAAVPVLTLFFFAAGVWAIHFGKERPRQEPLAVMLPLWLIVPVAVRMIPGITRYDGMRHVFISAVPIVIYAGVGFFALAKKSRRAALALCLLVPAVLGLEVARLHPFEGSYVNEAVRLMFRTRLEEQFDLTLWRPSLRQGMEWLNANASKNARVCAQGVILIECLKRDDLQMECGQADYYIVIPFIRAAPPEAAETPLFSISRYNTPIVCVYGKK